MKNKRIIFIAIFFIISLFNTLKAELFLSKDILKSHGIDYVRFIPIDISSDGNIFVGLEDVEDKKIKSEGFAYSLVVIRLKNKKLSKIEKVLLPMYTITNSTLNSVQNAVYISANYGTKIIKVDLDKLEPKVIFEYEENKPGFKSENFLFSHKKGVYATGYFYDYQQYWEGDYLVSIYEKNDKAEFVKEIKLDELFNKFKPKAYVSAFNFISGKLLFFNLVNPKEKNTSLMYYKNGEIKSIDKAYYISIFMGAENRVYYRKRDEKNFGIHILKDLNSGKKWEIGEKGNFTYTYPFISYKGDVLIVATIDFKPKKISYFIAKEKENFKLKPLLTNVTLASMKFAKSGKCYVYLPRDGIKIGYID